MYYQYYVISPSHVFIETSPPQNHFSCRFQSLICFYFVLLIPKIEELKLGYQVRRILSCIAQMHSLPSGGCKLCQTVAMQSK